MEKEIAQGVPCQKRKGRKKKTAFKRDPVPGANACQNIGGDRLPLRVESGERDGAKQRAAGQQAGNPKHVPGGGGIAENQLKHEKTSNG